MKKLLIICSILLLLGATVAGILFHIQGTPEYALIRIIEQVKKDGFEAIESNLTEEAYAKIEPVISIAKSDIVGSIVSLFADENYSNILIEKAKEIKWSVGDIIKNQRKANVTIGFDYEGMFQGTIDLELVKVDKKWKINNLYNLQIDKIDF